MIEVIPVMTPVVMTEGKEGTVTSIQIGRNGTVRYLVSYWKDSTWTEVWLESEFVTPRTLERQKIGFKR